jgi:hypothetical protein
MKLRTSLILAGIAVVVLCVAWVFSRPPGSLAGAQTVASGTLAFPNLAAKLGTATAVEITNKGQTLVITRKGRVWGLADRANYPVQQDKLRELLTGLTELRLAEPRTADPALLERLGLGDPSSATSTADLIKLLDDKGDVLAQMVVGHRRVRTQGNLPESIYVRAPGENQSWLAEGRLPADADPQLWLDRDIANIDAKRVASVVVHRGDATLVFARDGDKMVLKEPTDHPKLDDYSVEDVSRSLEALTLTDVKPAAAEPGEKIGTATITLTDGSVIEVTVFALAQANPKEPGAKDIWTQYAVRGDTDDARKLAARVEGWAYQVGAWKEKAFVPLLGDLKAEEKAPPAAAGAEKSE